MNKLTEEAIAAAIHTYPEAGKEEFRAEVTAFLWKREGFPVVSVSQEIAEGFVETDPPGEDPRWPKGWGPSFAVEIGSVTALVRTGMTSAPDDFLAELEDEVAAEVLASRSHIMFPKGDPFFAKLSAEEQRRLISNILYLLTEHEARSELGSDIGLTVKRRVPSPKANRKRHRKYYPGVEYVIGATRSLGSTCPKTGASNTGEGFPLSVRYHVRGFWRRQPCGPRYSLRKVTWVRPHWRGPEGAPISVHTTTLACGA